MFFPSVGHSEGKAHAGVRSVGRQTLVVLTGTGRSKVHKSALSPFQLLSHFTQASPSADVQQRFLSRLASTEGNR
jgi:hypothetical protein